MTEKLLNKHFHLVSPCDLDLWPSYPKTYTALLQVIIYQLAKYEKDPMKHDREIGWRRWWERRKIKSKKEKTLQQQKGLPTLSADLKNKKAILINQTSIFKWYIFLITCNSLINVPCKTKIFVKESSKIPVILSVLYLKPCQWQPSLYCWTCVGLPSLCSWLSCWQRTVWDYWRPLSGTGRKFHGRSKIHFGKCGSWSRGRLACRYRWRWRIGSFCHTVHVTLYIRNVKTKMTLICLEIIWVKYKYIYIYKLYVTSISSGYIVGTIITLVPAEQGRKRLKWLHLIVVNNYM